MTGNDPVEDYWRAVELAATAALLLIKAREDREDAVNRMHTAGKSYVRIGQDLGLSKSRVQQLVEAAAKRAKIGRLTITETETP